MPSSVDFGLVREIIGNSRFAGNPPSLTMDKRAPANYYQILFETGRGEDWSQQSPAIITAKIKQCIDTTIAMNELTLDGEWNEEIVAEFLTTAYPVYEAF